MLQYKWILESYAMWKKSSTKDFILYGSEDEWKNRMWYIHTAEYYSCRKRKELLIHTTSWVDLKNIMLNEKKQDIEN